MEATSSSAEIERLERKVDMSLDEIIKMQRKLQRKPRKSSTKFKKNGVHQNSDESTPAPTQQSRAVKSRAQSGESNMFAPKRTAQKFSRRTSGVKSKRRNRKYVVKPSHATGEANRDIRVLVTHDLRRRLLSSSKRSGVAARLSAGPERVLYMTESMLERGKLQPNSETLDSRFARLSRNRQTSSSLMQQLGYGGF
ncbi:hypothetical protein KP509_07G007200 [Ceratopteris richardii]|uniref:Uncharacterized protein n=1 Tax=Ceratopteris richardii TaxID=49495 RepID=A0A8T2U9N1_CERRI|nr:hypothetical protein KP509_07G007200 [Ceratopteris richardii]